MKLEDRAHVARAIWSKFSTLTGESPRDPTAREWYVLTGWLDRGIPLPVILRGFGEFQGRPRLLTAMEAPVERAYRYYAQAMALR